MKKHTLAGGYCAEFVTFRGEREYLQNHAWYGECTE